MNGPNQDGDAQMHRRGWIPVPENHAARHAVDRLLACAGRGGRRRALEPLFLHGPPGSGKSHLVGDLVAGFTLACPDAIVAILTAADLDGRDGESPDNTAADLVVVEDVQKLPVRAVAPLTGLVDRSLARQRQLVLTATAGPGQLDGLPGRLTSRLAQGLVVALAALGPASRAVALRRLADARGLNLDSTVIDYLAASTPGSFRQLEGALTRVAALGRAPRLEEVRTVLGEDAEARRLTLERIAHRVSRLYRVKPDELCSRARTRAVLVPRQVGMYLARRLTGLSLGQIGAYFGGRDHSTVLHACQKVEEALGRDPLLSSGIRELLAELA